MKLNKKIDLIAGSYILAVQYSSGTGNYSFSVNRQVVSSVPKNVKVNKVKLNKSSIKMWLGTSARNGKKITLKATVNPSNASSKGVTWKSSNKSVATVSSKGVVTARDVGTATITCTAKDGSRKKDTCKVTVVPGKAEFLKTKFLSRKVKFFIKKQSKVTGFEVYTKPDSGGKYKKYKTISAKKLTFTCPKTYYSSHKFRIRAYKKIGNKIYYGEYSNVWK